MNSKPLRPTKSLISDYAKELHKNIDNDFTRRKVIVFDIDDIWGADLVDMSGYSKENRDYKYILTVIDVFSKYAWAIPLKYKNSKSVLDAFKQIFKESKRKPIRLWIDQGGEFYNKEFETFMKKNNISMYSTYGEHKNSVIERFNKTIKNTMWKIFTSQMTFNYVDEILETILNDYNTENIHNTIKMTPENASKKENRDTVYNNVYKQSNINQYNPKFKIGDWVRISRLKGNFEKGYLPNWSREIFKIYNVMYTDPITYKIKEYDDTDIEGAFYEQELLKTAYSDVFEVEQIISKKKYKGKKQVFVKYLGWDKKYNQWIDEDQLQDNMTKK